MRNLYQYIHKIQLILNDKSKIYLGALLIMTLFFSLIETFGISMIMPFIALAANPDLVHTNSYYKQVYDFFTFSNVYDFISIIGVLLMFFYIFRGIYTYLYTYLLNKFSFYLYHNFSCRLLDRFLKLTYQKFVKKNTAEFTNTIMGEAYDLSVLIQNSLFIVSELLIVSLLYALLIFVNLKVTLIFSFFLGVKIYFIMKKTSSIAKELGNQKTYVREMFYKILSETFGNFKMIKLLTNEQDILSKFSNTSQQYARINTITSTLSIIPKSILETIGFTSLVGIITYILYEYKDVSFALPIISVFVLAMYRILPAVNRIMSSYAIIVYYKNTLNGVYDNLVGSIEIDEEGNDSIEFNNLIELKDISFGYNDKNLVLTKLNFTIKKGDKVAFVGKSGSGKSTLVDLIVGIYKPVIGNIYVDDEKVDNSNIKNWRSKVGYIPQSIYLFDGTVSENIAFGHTLDEDKVILAMKKANIYDFVMEKEGLDTIVGEGGILLSGGQKQRIGIARALYSNPDILVLDEATSALDEQTETEIMKEIYTLSEDKTLFIVAHRLSTIKKCNKKIELKNSKVIISSKEVKYD